MVTASPIRAILCAGGQVFIPFHIIYFIGLCIGSTILWRHARSGDRAPVAEDHTTTLDRALTALPALGMFVGPVCSTWTPWLAWADYQMGPWSLLPGIFFFAVGLWLLWRSHIDLGRHWSAGLQIRRGQHLVTHGVFSHIRHPLYAGYFLWGLAQPWLIHNWVAGLSMLVSFAPVYFYRVTREERMMQQYFPEYATYMLRTDRLWPWKWLACTLLREPVGDVDG